MCLSNNPAERALGGIALGPGRNAPGVGVRHQQHADEAQAVDAHFLAEQGYGEEREERCGVTSAIAIASGSMPTAVKLRILRKISPRRWRPLKSNNRI